MIRVRPRCEIAGLSVRSCPSLGPKIMSRVMEASFSSIGGKRLPKIRFLTLFRIPSVDFEVFDIL